ncbi:MAG: hypothetical protein LBM70_07630 [Victivallales bacterium]|jgi:hypothetical protein|nr:hypothetical protein [Victivallales bacterium]
MKYQNTALDKTRLIEALQMLNERLILDAAPYTELVVCGGSALIATGLLHRTTRDIDIITLMCDNELKDAEPLPKYLINAANIVGHSLGLPNNWLNNGPASQFRMGLPEGFQTRLSTVRIGEKLTMHYVGRYDQIFFKTYASADRGGYHVSDLLALNPTDEELIAASHWCMTQDVSEAFREILKDMFSQLERQNVSDRI